jgi:hypothetical protein
MPFLVRAQSELDLDKRSSKRGYLDLKHRVDDLSLGFTLALDQACAWSSLVAAIPIWQERVANSHQWQQFSGVIVQVVSDWPRMAATLPSSVRLSFLMRDRLCQDVYEYQAMTDTKSRLVGKPRGRATERRPHLRDHSLERSAKCQCAGFMSIDQTGEQALCTDPPPRDHSRMLDAKNPESLARLATLMPYKGDVSADFELVPALNV